MEGLRTDPDLGLEASPVLLKLSSGNASSEAAKEGKKTSELDLARGGESGSGSKGL